jgi:hypothetical protein
MKDTTSSSVLLASDFQTSGFSIWGWSINRFDERFYPLSSMAPPYVFISRFSDVATDH